MRASNKTRLFTLLAILLTASHFAFLSAFFAPAISTPDAHSYFVQAKILAREGKTSIETESVLQYIGPHWSETSPNRYHCTHPPGLAFILSIPYRLFGPYAALWANLLLASLALLGLFLLVQLWVGDGWALLAAVLMAVNPVANEHALFGDSHVALACFLVWGLFFLARWLSTRSPWWAFFAGLFLGALPAIRYAEGLYLLAAGLFAGWFALKERLTWRSPAAGLLGAALPLGALVLRNQFAYGAFWKTGYALTHEQSAFGLNFFLQHSPLYLRKLLGEGGAFSFALGAIGLVLLCAQPKERTKGMLLAVLIIPITLLYMSWYWTPDAQSMRFLLPTFYLYAIAAAWLLALLAPIHRRASWTCGLVLLALTLWWGLPRSFQAMGQLQRQNRAIAQAAEAIQNRVEKGSLLIAPEGLCQDLDFIGSWKLVSLAVLRPEASQEESPSDASTPQGPQHDAGIRRRFGSLAPEEYFSAVRDEVWTWSGSGRKVYLVAYEDQAAHLKTNLPAGDTLITLERIKLSTREAEHSERPEGFEPLGEGGNGFPDPHRPMGGPPSQFGGRPGPNQVFDLQLNGEPLWLYQWKRASVTGVR